MMINNIGDRGALSYRDPHGYVFEDNGLYYRVVDHSYAEQYRHLIESGLYDALVQQHLITSFSEIEELPVGFKGYKLLMPEQLCFLSYPYEWCFQQWQGCLNVFLKVNKVALSYGMILKDATPFNFTFHRGKFVLFDILSFEFYNDGDPWIAYRQFCENFLAPLSLMRFRQHGWSKLYRAAISGFDLQFASANLPFSSWFDLNCLLHIHLHSRFKSKKTGIKKPEQSSYLQKDKLLQLLTSLSSVGKWRNSLKDASLWDDYYEAEIETESYLKAKQETVENWFKKLNPKTVLDLGANTGKFSFLAAKYAEKVIALESDLASLQVLNSSVGSQNNIYPVCIDIADPSPDQGWGNAEKKALFKRFKADTVMALAIIHHLRITYNVPLSIIAQLFATLTTDYLILEFVSKSDSQLKTMLEHRQDIYHDYTLVDLKHVLSEYFDIQQVVALGTSERSLLLLKKINPK